MSAAPPPPRGVMVKIYEWVVTPTKPEGEKASGDGREYLREAKSGTHFSIPMPPPAATATEVNRARLAGFRRKKYQIMQTEQGFESVNATKRFTAQLNAINRGSPIKPSKKQLRAEAALREAATLERRLRIAAEHEAKRKQLRQIEELKRQREAAAIMARATKYDDDHLKSSLVLRDAMETLQERAEDNARLTSAVEDVLDDVCARGEENAEGEAEGEEEEESDEGSQAEEDDTPPLDPALSPSLAIGVPVGSNVAEPVAEPQRVTAPTATGAVDSVLAPVGLDPFPPPAPPRPASVDVSPTIAAAPTGPLSPELEAAPSAPGAVNAMLVSSELGQSLLVAELKALEAKFAEEQAKLAEEQLRSAKWLKQRDQARQDAKQAAWEKQSAVEKTARRLRAERDDAHEAADQLRTQLEEMHAQRKEQDETAALQAVLKEEHMSKGRPPSPSNAAKPKPSGPSAKPRPVKPIA